MDKGKIYKIVNKITNGVYIGCTINSLEKRYNEHIYRCFKTDINTKLYNSIRKYGIENFYIELIEDCDVSIIYETEKKYIKQYDSFENGMNTTFGGEGCLGYKHSAEIRKKISNQLKKGDSHKNKTYNILYGENSEKEKEKRKKTVKKFWDNLSEENKKLRIDKMKETKRSNSKYSIEFIKELKDKIKNGIKIKEFSEQYPNLKKDLFYELKNGRIWKEI